jgi:apolipoprotein N-acyltransferase
MTIPPDCPIAPNTGIRYTWFLLRNYPMKFAKIFSMPILTDGICILAGILLVFAFAPYHLFPLAILSPAILLTSWLNASSSRCFVRGWLFGLGFFGAGVFWVFISIHTFGEVPAWIAGLITAGFVSILALFPACQGWIFWDYFSARDAKKILYIFPALWVLFEWIRSWIFTGFPWLFLGYSQTNSPLKGYAPILSVYGVSLAVVASSALLVHILRKIQLKNYKYITHNLLILGLIWLLGFGLSFIHWTKPLAEPIQVSLVQGSIAQEVKWTADSVQPTKARYQDLSAPHWDSKIVIWPESALPISLQDAQEFLTQISAIAQQHNATFITGIPVQLPNDDYYNAVIAMGAGHGAYYKHRLVPFGEYIPLEAIFKKFFNILNISMTRFVPASLPALPLIAGNLKIVTFICYEIAYPELTIKNTINSNIILTVSNDAWFGHSNAQAQHLQIAQMRALELGRPLLFVANNGITAAIKPNGMIQASIAPYQAGVLTTKIQPMSGKTPWQWLGLNPIIITLLTLLFINRKTRDRLT